MIGQSDDHTPLGYPVGGCGNPRVRSLTPRPLALVFYAFGVLQTDRKQHLTVTGTVDHRRKIIRHATLMIRRVDDDSKNFLFPAMNNIYVTKRLINGC